MTLPLARPGGPPNRSTGRGPSIWDAGVAVPGRSRIVLAWERSPQGGYRDSVIVREYYQQDALDPVLDAEFVLSLVQRHVPHASQLTSVDESGGEARTYLVDETIVLKVQRPHQLRSWTSLAKEVAFLRQIEEDDPALPVPRVLGYGREESVEYTCMTRMAGDAAVRSTIPDAVRSETLGALGRVIRRVHAISQAPLRASGLFPEEYTPADLRMSVAEDVHDLAESIAKSGQAWPLSLRPEQLAHVLAERVPETEMPIALHTNPGPTHTFVDPDSGRLTGLIDFGDAYIGHPAFDLWQWGDPSDRQAVLAGYLESGPLDAEFWSMWDAAQVVSDLVAISRRRPYLDRSARHLKELVAGW